MVGGGVVLMKVSLHLASLSMTWASALVRFHKAKHGIFQLGLMKSYRFVGGCACCGKECIVLVTLQANTSGLLKPRAV